MDFSSSLSGYKIGFDSTSFGIKDGMLPSNNIKFGSNYDEIDYSDLAIKDKDSVVESNKTNFDTGCVEETIKDKAPVVESNKTNFDTGCVEEEKVESQWTLDIDESKIIKTAFSNFFRTAAKELAKADGLGSMFGFVFSAVIHMNDSSGFNWKYAGKMVKEIATTTIKNDALAGALSKILPHVPFKTWQTICGKSMITVSIPKFLTSTYSKEIVLKSSKVLFENGIEKIVPAVTTNLGKIAQTGALTLGLDYAFSVVGNAIVGLTDGTPLTLDELHLGSTALKSTTKTIFATAGELIGGSTGKIIGTAVGATIAEIQVAAFTDENGNIDELACAVAAGAEIVGAVVAVSLYVFISSNPVGWAVGAVMIVGAGIGFAAVYLFSHGTEIWGHITDAADLVVDFVGNTFVGLGDSVASGGVAVNAALDDVADNLMLIGQDARDKAKKEAEILRAEGAKVKAAMVETCGVVVEEVTYVLSEVVDFIGDCVETVTSWIGSFCNSVGSFFLGG